MSELEAWQLQQSEVWQTELRRLVQGEIIDLRTQLTDAKVKIEELQILAGANWTAHQPWDSKHLPVPRVEMNHQLAREAKHSADYITAIIATSYLVIQHREGVEAIPLGQTRCHGGWTSVERALLSDNAGVEALPLYLPVHDGARAFEIAQTLKLPMYVTFAEGVRDLAYQLTLENGKYKMLARARRR